MLTWIIRRDAPTLLSPFRKATSRSLKSLSTYSRTAPAASYSLDESPVTGTVPHHDFLLVLNTKLPPNTWPARLEMSSPLLSELQQKVKKLGGLVNFAYEGTDDYQPAADWEKSTSQKEEYSGLLYMRGSTSPVAFPRVTLGAVMAELFQHKQTQLESPDPPVLDFYVCTHGNRDCKCGDIGGEFVDRLHYEVARLPANVRFGEDGNPLIRVREIGHVGGHKSVKLSVSGSFIL